MADKQLNALTAAAALSTADLFLVEQGGNSRKATGTQVQALVRIVRAAMVKKAADQTTANYSAGAIVAFDAEIYDTDGFHDNVTDNSRLTVPASVTYVRVGFRLWLSFVSASSDINVRLYKNGSETFDGGTGNSHETSATTPNLSAASGPIPVAVGDYFEVHLTCSDTSITLHAALSNFWIEVLE